jgi:hypothetical protein
MANTKYRSKFFSSPHLNSDIGPGLKATLLEAFAAAAGLLSPTLQEKFVLVGGTSMLALGGKRKTTDVDIVVAAEALNAFQEAATKSIKTCP